MNATPQPHIRGRSTNGDLTPWLSHEAVCTEEEMGVTGGAFSKGGGRGCVCCDETGRGKNSGSGTQRWPLNPEMHGVGCAGVGWGGLHTPDGSPPLQHIPT